MNANCYGNCFWLMGNIDPQHASFAMTVAPIVFLIMPVELAGKLDALKQYRSNTTAKFMIEDV
jgi:hypothetical protein